MKFQYYKDMFAKTFDFNGKTGVAEFWNCVLYNFIFSTAFILAGLPFVADLKLFVTLASSLAGLYDIVVFLPTLSLTIRRLHDAGHSSWSLILALIPFIGAIILILYLASPSNSKVEVWNNGQNDNFNNSNQYDDGVNNVDSLFIFGDINKNNTETYNSSSQNLKDENSVANTDKNGFSKTNRNELDAVHLQKEEIISNKTNVDMQQSLADNQDNGVPIKETAIKRKSSATTVKAQANQDRPKTRSQKIAELQEERDSGKITNEEYQKRVLDILKHWFNDLN